MLNRPDVGLAVGHEGADGMRRRGRRVDLLRSVGIDACLLAPELARFESQDWRARTRFGALLRALNQFGKRARPQAADLQQAAR
jgi:hypothetical protein